MKRIQNNPDTQQILNVIEDYNTALTLLDDYGHQSMKLIDQMRFNADSDLFGHEKDDSFKGSIGNIYQSFGDEDVYPSLEEKAVNLLYYYELIYTYS